MASQEAADPAIAGAEPAEPITAHPVTAEVATAGPETASPETAGQETASPPAAEPAASKGAASKAAAASNAAQVPSSAAPAVANDVDASPTITAILGTPPPAAVGQTTAKPILAIAPPAGPVPPASLPDGIAAEASTRGQSVGLDSPGFGQPNRAPAGSLADLRARLARLPAGHPSSAYDDGGRARPLPIRLRQLELGLPAPGRELGGNLTPDFDRSDIDLPGTIDAEDAELEHRPDLIESGPPDPGEVAAEDGETEAADLAPAPDDVGSSARHEWDKPDAKASNARSVPASGGPDLALAPWRAGPPAHVGGLEGLSARSGNGHGRSNGSTVQHQIVEPAPMDLRALVEHTLATCRTAEGRDAFGGYGNSGLTPAIRRLAAHLPFGGLATGSEANSLKSPQRFAAKLARLIERNPGRTREELAAAIGDVVRYAFAFAAVDYAEGTWLVHRRLKSHGFELEIRRNRWESPEYKGIFTQWRDPAHHLAFEIQFHTTASWDVMQRTHDAYVQITDPATPPAKRARLRALQVAAAAKAKAPPGWPEIGDFRLEPR